MSHVGIVACSAEGAALCYTSMCQQAAALVGKNNHPRVTMDSIALADWMPAFKLGDYEQVGEVMLRSAELLAAAGADFLICPDNSAHRAWEFIEDRSPVPFVHIAAAVGAEAKRRGFQRVGVLGTRFTMDGPVYPDALAPLGIESLAPSEADKDLIDHVIFSELIDGIITDQSRYGYQQVIKRLKQQGCDAVAFACTEIPLLISADDAALPVLDSTRLLAGAAVNRALRA